MSLVSILPSFIEVMVAVGIVVLMMLVFHWFSRVVLSKPQSQRATRQWRRRSRLQRADPVDLAKAHAEWKRQRARFASRGIPAKDIPSETQAPSPEIPAARRIGRLP